MAAPAPAPILYDPIQVVPDLGASIEKSARYIPQEKRQEFKLEVESKLNKFKESLIQGAEKYIEPGKQKHFREFFKIQFTRALEECIKSLFNDVLANSTSNELGVRHLKEIWEGLNLRIETMSRRLDLISPSTPEDFMAALWWVAEQGTEEDLKLLREVRSNLPYDDADIIKLLGIVEEKLAEKVDDPEYVVRKGEEAYQRNKEEWDSLYEGKYIAIHKGAVLYADADESSLIKTVIEEQKRQQKMFRVYIVEVGAPVLNLRPPGPRPRAEAGRETGGEEGTRRSPADVQGLGWAAFREQLSGLLETDAGRWVAFHGRTRVALTDTNREVYEQLTRDGVPLNEVIVCRVAPLAPPIDPRRRRGRRVR